MGSKRWTAKQAAAIAAKAERKAAEADAAAKEAKELAKAAKAAKRQVAADQAAKLAEYAAEYAAEQAAEIGETPDQDKKATPKRKGMSRKTAILKLGDLDWADQFFAFALGRIERKKGAHEVGAINFVKALCFARLTGLRPEELGKGVEYERTATGINIVIKGAKLATENGKRVRGIRTRALEIEADFNPEAKWLNADMQGSGVKTWSYKKGTFRQSAGRVLAEFLETDTFKSWDVKHQRIFKNAFSPYLYRNLLAQQLIDSDQPACVISVCMGHRSTESIQSYARRRGKTDGISPVASINIGVSDQVICHETKAVLFDGKAGFIAEGSRPGWSPKQTAPKKLSPSGPKM